MGRGSSHINGVESGTKYANILDIRAFFKGFGSYGRPAGKYNFCITDTLGNLVRGAFIIPNQVGKPVPYGPVHIVMVYKISIKNNSLHHFSLLRFLDAGHHRI